MGVNILYIHIVEMSKIERELDEEMRAGVYKDFITGVADEKFVSTPLPAKRLRHPPPFRIAKCRVILIFMININNI